MICTWSGSSCPPRSCRLSCRRTDLTWCSSSGRIPCIRRSWGPCSASPAPGHHTPHTWTGRDPWLSCDDSRNLLRIRKTLLFIYWLFTIFRFLLNCSGSQHFEFKYPSDLGAVLGNYRVTFNFVNYWPETTTPASASYKEACRGYVSFYVKALV